MKHQFPITQEEYGMLLTIIAGSALIQVEKTQDTLNWRKCNQRYYMDFGQAGKKNLFYIDNQNLIVETYFYKDFDELLTLAYNTRKYYTHSNGIVSGINSSYLLEIKKGSELVHEIEQLANLLMFDKDTGILKKGILYTINNSVVKPAEFDKWFQHQYSLENVQINHANTNYSKRLSFSITFNLNKEQMFEALSQINC